MRPRLTQISLHGFKTIRELEVLKPGRLTVLIGPNGAGKSNLLSIFRLLSTVLKPPGELGNYVALQGGASTLLHGGAAVTGEIEGWLLFETGAGRYGYLFRLRHAAGDSLIFYRETITFNNEPGNGFAIPGPGSGLGEAHLITLAQTGPRPISDTAKIIIDMLGRVIVHHFHD